MSLRRFIDMNNERMKRLFGDDYGDERTEIISNVIVLKDLGDVLVVKYNPDKYKDTFCDEPIE